MAQQAKCWLYNPDDPNHITAERSIASTCKFWHTLSVHENSLSTQSMSAGSWLRGPGTVPQNP